MPELDELLAALQSPTVTDASILVREVRVQIGILPEPIAIRVYYGARGAERYRFEVSAKIDCGRGSVPHDESRSAATEAEALRNAVRMLTRDYDDAVRRGELPDDRWLVKAD